MSFLQIMRSEKSLVVVFVIFGLAGLWLLLDMMPRLAALIRAFLESP